MQINNRITPLITAVLGLALTAMLSAEPLRTVTWNMEWFPGGRPGASEKEQAEQTKGAKEILGKLAPQILLAQELTDEKAFANLMKEFPGMKVDVFSKFLDTNSGNPDLQQCAIASSLKAHSAWFVDFALTENLPSLRRGFAFAALEHPDGGLIMLYSVHMKSNNGSDTPEGELNIAKTRAESTRQIIAHKAAMEKQFAGEKIVGWLIAGDFNTNDDGQFPKCTVVKDFLAAGFHNTWDKTPKENRLTWRNHPDDERFKPTTFDFMMTIGFKENQAKVYADVPLEISDHTPVMLLLEK
ncbi:MAG: hypothetical protein NWT08_11600 [Akkermansiaceae bacterium]|jgi:endonuclease/exonuclease/phosphatase family metal-dependent hydrolase|nr:hypothetical protein [Akkermansiaceae bacterium]MDP4646410.1 hypothetical protein [Akkermansiaceae bacterium]MDP4721513.1 hypothetical protein [Akkermansiaceae bacterium]MDP4780013.1 hypothetical protein [Akkermansiaceae bacterium]MDP4847061.1 hypothetical protein [Akkermansiaceae bacterium]